LYALDVIVYDARSGAEVYQQAPEWEQRLSELQAQIDRLSLSLHLWRQSQDHLQPLERRLAQLTDQCSGLLEQWTLTGERHAQAVGQLEHRLSDWNDVESRLHGDTSERLRDLERMIEHEWAALRQIHQEPVKELREQAASLTEACVAAATSARSGFERAEARLAGFESAFHERMSELSREIQSALGELRARLERQPALPSAAAAWPLEGVMRLHNQLRESERDAEQEGPLPPAGHGILSIGAAGETASSASELSERVESLARALNDEKFEIRETVRRTEQSDRKWHVAVALLGVGVVAAAGLALRLQQQVGVAAARATAAENQAQAAAQAASQRIAATEASAAQQIAAAREAATRAQTVSDVLAAPDLVRFVLSGGGAGSRYTALLLWSRTRGLVLSGSRLPAPPENTTYQVWLLTESAPVAAGAFVPDSGGRATLALRDPPRVPRPVVGVLVTIEPPGGSAVPSGQTLLARVPLARGE
jgi:hypothetical protein